MNSYEETIAAIASAPGGGARGIVRISGPAAVDCVRPLFMKRSKAADTNPSGASSSDQADPFPSSAPTALAGELRLPEFHSPIPADLFVWPTERSYTRRPSVELHVPGSAPIVAAVLIEVCRRGARPAKPGEFTLQAFLAGRIDLTQAEAVLGVVDAADERSLASALKQMAGGLAEPLRRLRSDLLELIADLEAGLDFVEEDLEFIDRATLVARLDAAHVLVVALGARMSARGEATELPRVVLVGRPNVGKSTLFNALAGSERALVSSTAGTTRDYLTCRLMFAGVEFELIDTAGFEVASTRDVYEESGIDAASQRAAHSQRREADLVVHCLDDVSDFEAPQVEASMLVVRTKADLADCRGEIDSAPGPGANALRLISHPARTPVGPKLKSSEAAIAVSAATGVGIDELKQAIARKLVAAQSRSGDVVGATAVRCRDSLRRAAEALAEAERVARSRIGDELVAAELRSAIDELGRIAGVVYTDDILDRIFSRFCIGK